MVTGNNWMSWEKLVKLMGLSLFDKLEERVELAIRTDLKLVSSYKCWLKMLIEHSNTLIEQSHHFILTICRWYQGFSCMIICNSETCTVCIFFKSLIYKCHYLATTALANALKAENSWIITTDSYCMGCQ